MIRERNGRLVLSAVFLWIVVVCHSDGRIVHAEPDGVLCMLPELRGQVVLFLVDEGKKNSFELPLFPTGTTDLYFEMALTGMAGIQPHDLRFLAGEHSLTLKPTNRTAGRVTLHAGDTRIEFKLGLVKGPEQAYSIVVVRRRSADDVGKPSRQVIARHICTGPDVSEPVALLPLAGKMPGMSSLISRATERAILTEVLRGRDELPKEGPGRDENERGENEQGVTVAGYTWEIFGRFRILIFELQNPDPRPYRIGELQLFDELKLHNHAGEVKVGFDEELAPASPDKVFGTVPAGGRVLVAVSVHDPDTVGRFMHLSLREPGGSRPVMREGLHTWTFKEPPDMYEGWVTLSVWGTYGALWLGEGVGANRFDATAFEMLGARATYAFNKYLHVEASAAVGRSGDARFDGAMFNGMQGDLARSATLGRLQVGGLLRWGRTVMPTLRGTLGAQLSTMHAEFVPGGSGMPMEMSSSTEFGAIWSFSAGADVRLGQSLILGAELGLEQTASDDNVFVRSAGIGVHLGFTWKP